MKIQEIHAVQIFDSRGYPTLHVSVFTDKGDVGCASVPSGASKGKREALEKRDGNPQEYEGKGVSSAVESIHQELRPLLLGSSLDDLTALDRKMCDADGTPNKARLGANVLLAISLASARAAALAAKKPLYRFLGKEQVRYELPCPMVNVLNGGLHANNPLDLQEIMIRPRGAGSFREAMHWCAEIFYALRRLIQEQGWSTSVGDEGGFAPPIVSWNEACALVLMAIEAAKLRPWKDVTIALDCAASSFFDEETKLYRTTKNPKIAPWTSEEQMEHLSALLVNYPIDSIEDGMAETDELGWQLFTKQYSCCLQIVGDDLFVTNTALLANGVKKHLANAILLKPNQIGTLSEMFDCMHYAHKHHYQTILSHRSGETEDTFLADLCVGAGIKQIKAGSLSRSERVAKYNRLLLIEDELQLHKLL